MNPILYAVLNICSALFLWHFILRPVAVFTITVVKLTKASVAAERAALA